MRAGIYARISRDATDEGQGVDRQVKDCRAMAERLGWEVADLYPDNDISASTRSRKPRPEYDRLLADARAGRIQAILAYSNSRLTRRVREYLDLIDLVRETGVVIKTVVSGEHDLSTADGRAAALTVATWDAAEAERTGERIKRQKAERAAQGLPQGGRYRVYGYTRAFEPVEDEAPVVRDIFDRRARGVSATAIAKHLNDQGHTTAAGNRWSASSVAKLVSRSGYAGLRSVNGEVIGATSYPALVTEAKWRQANSLAAQSSHGTNARRHLLSGIAVCGRCHHSMVGSAALGGYRCNATHGGCGNLRIKAEWLEDPVISLVLAGEAAQEPAPGPVEPRVDVEAIDAEIRAARAAWAAGDLALADLTPMLAALRAKRREAEKQMAAQPGGRFWGPLMVWDEWDDADLSTRRALLTRHLDSIVVGPRQSKGPGRYEPERITIRWQDGTTQQVTAADLSRIPLRDSVNAKWRIPKNSKGEWVGMTFTWIPGA